MIRYFTEDCSFDLKRRRVYSAWVKSVCVDNNKKVGDLNIIFCSDEYLLNLNIEHLSHNYYTDVITFDYCTDDIISGDLFISVDTVRENALEYAQAFDNELSRVIVHGVLHLLKFDDDTEENQKEMRSKEDFYLSKLELK